LEEKEISGYQVLKLILSDMEKRKYQKVEMEYGILLKFLKEFQNIKYQKNFLLDEIDKYIIMLDQDKQQLFLFIIDLLRDLKSRGEWIEYKNNTVHTKEYYRIEKETLEKIIEEKAAGIDTKKTLDFMANLGILRKQADKILSSATVKGVPKRIYMVRIDSVDFIE
jgi:hypothetical protein